MLPARKPEDKNRLITDRQLGERPAARRQAERGTGDRWIARETG